MTDPEPDSRLTANYPYLLVRDQEEGGFFAEHATLEGCASQGDTAAEAVANLDDARELWIETRLDDGLAVPEPVTGELSGRTSLRIPVFVHAELADYAERLGFSLNKLLNRALSGFVEGGSVASAGALLSEADVGIPPRPVKDRTYHLSLKYPYVLVRDVEDGGFFAEHSDLEGCASQGETAEEAIANLDDARELWIETRLEDGLPIPEPLSQEHSGYVSLRMNPALHAQLVLRAADNDVSLNQLISSVLGGVAGWIAAADAARPGLAPTVAERAEARQAIRQATLVFRGGRREWGHESLLACSEFQASFLLGLLYLECGEYDEALTRFKFAYVNGFDFAAEANEVYQGMPEAPDYRTLHGWLLPLCHLSEKRKRRDDPVIARIAAWIADMKHDGKKQANLKRERRYLSRYSA